MAETLTLERTYYPDRTQGRILRYHPEFDQFLQLCLTMELPWLDNRPMVSCIPEGIYPCIPHDSAAHPHVWEIAGVAGRSGILIHNGNTDADSEGCILVGDSFGMLGGVPAVLGSVKTLDMLRRELPANFRLRIRKGDAS